MNLRVLGIDHVVLRVVDVDRSLGFYEAERSRAGARKRRQARAARRSRAKWRAAGASPRRDPLWQPAASQEGMPQT